MQDVVDYMIRCEGVRDIQIQEGPEDEDSTNENHENEDSSGES